MTRRAIDLERLRVALRRLSRGNLLVIAERATELVPRAKVRALLGDFVRLGELAEPKSGAAPLLEEVRKFREASQRGDYYEGFDVNSKNFMRKSEGTEAFIAEFDRLVGKCVRAAEKTPGPPLREAFELLFGLLRDLQQEVNIKAASGDSRECQQFSGCFTQAVRALLDSGLNTAWDAQALQCLASPGSLGIEDSSGCSQGGQDFFYEKGIAFGEGVQGVQ